MKVVLVQPPLVGRLDQAYPPASLAFLKVYLVDRHPTKAIDMSVYDSQRAKQWLTSEPFDVIGITSYTYTRNTARKIALLAREINPRCKIVLGGSHPSSFPEQCLETMDADAVVVGEGEVTFRELVDAYDDHTDLSLVRGIVFRRDNGFVRTLPRPLIPNLDEMRRPDFSDFPPENYRGYSLEFVGLDARKAYRGDLLSSRGCPFHCSYCSTAAYWSRKARAMSPKVVVDQMEWLQKQRGVGFISFLDDLFTTDRKRVVAICEEIIRRGLKIPWMADARVDTVDEEELRLMRRAHCFALYYGMESGSPAILKNIDKGATVEETLRAIHWTRAAGIKVLGLFMVGNPGETLSTVRETFDLWLKIDPEHNPGASLTTIYPDTALYKLAKEKGIIDDEYWRTEKPAPLYTVDHWAVTLHFYRFYLYSLWAIHKYRQGTWEAKLDILLRSVRYAYRRMTGSTGENLA